MAKQKEATFSESLDLDRMVTARGKKGIYMIAGNPTGNNFIRLVKIFDYKAAPVMSKLKDLKFILNFEIPSTKKQPYKFGQLLDNLFKIAEGGEYNKKITKTFIKKLAPSIDPEYKIHLIEKLVQHYNYIIVNIESTFDVKLSDEKELLTTK